MITPELLEVFRGIADEKAVRGTKEELSPGKSKKIDVNAKPHLVRVFYRMGVSDAETATSASTATENLSVMDRIAANQAAWHIGRTYCYRKNPNCFECPVEPICPRVESEPPEFRSKKHDLF